MIDALRDAIESLISLMREETAMLLSAGPRPDIEVLASAKVRLTATLEGQLAALDREEPGWRETVAETDAELAAAIAELQEVSTENATVLRRQIDLSRELMDAIAAEAKRLVGTRSQTYGATGGLFRQDVSTPISVNTNL